MRIALYRHKVTIQQPSTGKNSAGAPAPAWSTLAIRWAGIKPLSGREYIAAQAAQSKTSHEIRMRWDSTVSATVPKMRVVYGARTFEIISAVNENERNKTLVLMCEEKTS